MRAWAQMFNDFLAARGDRRAVHRRATTSTTSTASPATTGVRVVPGLARHRACPRATRRPADAETVCGLGNRKNDVFGEVLRDRGRRRRTPARCALLDQLRRARAPRSRSSPPRATPRRCSPPPAWPTASRSSSTARVAAERGLRRQARPRHLPVRGRRSSASPAERAVVVEDALSGVAGRARRRLRPGDRRRPRRRCRRADRRPAPTSSSTDLAELVTADAGGDRAVDARPTPVAATRSTGTGSRSTSGGWSRPRTTPSDLGRHRDAVRRRQRLPRACAATSRRAARPTRTAPSSTASTRPGRSGTPRRRSASPGSARPSSTSPTPRSIRLYVDDEPLLLAVADLESTTSARSTSATGVLTRDIIWRTPGGKRVQVESTRMVSFTAAAPGGDDLRGHAARRRRARW